MERRMMKTRKESQHMIKRRNNVNTLTLLMLPLAQIRLTDFDFLKEMMKDNDASADSEQFGLTIQDRPNPTPRIHKIHPLDQVIGYIANQHTNKKRCLSNLGGTLEEPKKVIHALKDPRWIEAMQEELLQFKLQEVWTLVDLPHGKRAIGSKWVFRNKNDERGIMIRNKARLVAQGYT
ncbi:putative ribonuclease H-like domain-containing protein [Tanacetum coccineum]